MDVINSVLDAVVILWSWIEKVCSAFWGGLEWPHAVLIIFISLVYIFKPEIKVLILRVRRAGAGGFEFEPAAEQEPPSVSATPIDLPAAEYTTTYNEALFYVNQELESIPAADREAYLISNNARWRVIWLFETIYSYIFNGQIELLQNLNQRQVSGMSMSEARVEWVSYKARFGNALDQWELDNWLSFLTTRGLIVIRDDALHILPKGKEFLVWIVQTGRARDRNW